MGDYIYERFTPDRFQTFCSALLRPEYPGYQVFPVGQADGGRDGTAQSKGNQGSIVIQVKFKRELKANDNYFVWLKNSILKEKNNIDKLIEKGADLYKLVTNIPGTGKDSTGLIDKVQAFLAENFTIPVQVLWRDDLDARLSSNYDLKWMYSEILATPDVVRGLLEERFGRNNATRLRAVRAYIRAQYDIDAFVKFKQADLQASDLLNLFIDVPGDLPAQQKLPRPARHRLVNMFADVLTSGSSESIQGGANLWGLNMWAEGNEDLGRLGVVSLPVGSLLLHPTTAQLFPRMLIEGAPGQGKSTLAQYVCQVHRMHFLGIDGDLKRLPKKHQSSPTRMPFKIDLRDLATWLEGLNPRKSQTQTKHGLPTSLESFIAADVAHLSGGQQFSVSDLHELAETTPIIIVLDGFDEIATPHQRSVVVTEIEKGLARLNEGALSVQSIVTSRPSAMPDSPKFNPTDWTTVALSSITTELALEYAHRWSSARKLTLNEEQEVTGILADKIGSPHLSDLARNPMQLTILLSLIHVRGQSLPDQRTSLYESYIEVFFNREAEKTSVVRDNRQLLLDLHGYLAWKMHSNAELSRGDGRLSSSELQSLIRDWLLKREYPESSLEDLFEGVIQRIVAIVSRVEGTFEFEVQPLREYFAAHHLYHTAPYSPPGRPQNGTKPEILDALLDNPYWQNVLRFFAGFYSVGEIPGLASELIDRIERPIARAQFYDRIASIHLLSDWVFHQQPTWTRKVTVAAIDDLTLRWGSDRSSSGITDFHLSLPADCGGRYVGDYAYEAVSRANWQGAAAVVHRHISTRNLIKMWMDEARTIPSFNVTAHIGKGVRLRLMGAFSAQDLIDIRQIWEMIPDLDEKLFEAGCSVVLGDADQQSLLARTLEGEISMGTLGGHWSLLARVLDPVRQNESLIGHHLYIRDSEDSQNHEPTMSAEIVAVLESLVEALRSEEAKTDLTPWQQAIDILNYLRPESFVAHQIANTAAGIRSSAQRGAGAKDLFDTAVPLTQRVRYARLRPNGTEWWKDQYRNALDRGMTAEWALHLCSWGNPATIIALIDELEQALSDMSANRYRLVLRSISSNYQKPNLIGPRKVWNGPLTLDRFKILFLFASKGDTGAQDKAIQASRDGSISLPEWALSEVSAWIIRRMGTAPTAAQWRSAVADIERIGWTDTGDLALRWFYHRETISPEHLSEPTARRILNRPLQMPAKLVHAAVSRLERSTPAPAALGQIAYERNWAAI